MKEFSSQMAGKPSQVGKHPSQVENWRRKWPEDRRRSSEGRRNPEVGRRKWPEGCRGQKIGVANGIHAVAGGYIGQLNNAPVVTTYPVTVTSNTVIKVPIAALLSSVKDVDGDSVTFVSVADASAQSGAASRIGNFVVYRPANGFNGGDSVTWVAQDSEGDRAAGTILAQVGAPPAPPDQPALNLVSITFNHAPGATDATLRFAGLPQSTYLVQYTDSLVPPVTWTSLGTVSVTNGVFQIVDPTAGGASQRYYRTVYQSP